MEEWMALEERGKSMCEGNGCIKGKMAEEQNESMKSGRHH